MGARDVITDRQRRWVIRYLLANTEASCLNQGFHDAFFAEFGGPRKLTNWGSQPVHAAMRVLKALAKDGTAEAVRVSLRGARQPGFPYWVHTYRISDFGRATYGGQRGG